MTTNTYWSKAPEGTTHMYTGLLSGGFYWRKLTNETVYYWEATRHKWIALCNLDDLPPGIKYVSRPTESLEQPATEGIDWSKAPDGTTHFYTGAFQKGDDTSVWRNITGGFVYSWTGDHWSVICEFRHANLSHYAARPTEPTIEGMDVQELDVEEIHGEPAPGVAQTLNERGDRYGKFTDHSRIAQLLQDAMRSHCATGSLTPGWDKLNAHQKQALTVIADKIARILNGDPNYADNWHDIQGYAKLCEDALSTQPEVEVPTFTVKIVNSVDFSVLDQFIKDLHESYGIEP